VLDDLRGIAILTVIFYHYFFVYFRNSEDVNNFIQIYRNINDYINLGAYGVSLFFLVSGFVISMSLKGDNNLINMYNFFIRRFFRLYPTYWFSIILISTIILLFKDSNAYSLKQILINFTMFQDILKTPHIDGVFWTLMIELKFYILTSILFYFGYLKKIEYVVFILLLLSILTLILSQFYDRTFGNKIISYLMLMYLGSAFFYSYNEKISEKVKYVLISVVFLYFSINHFFLIGTTEYGSKIGYSLATCLAILTFIFTINIKRTISRTTTFFGNISYSLYLIHQVLGYFLIDLLFDSLFSQVIAFSILTIASFFIFKFIEKPTNNFGHKYVRKF
jgi:peptidoglycan/LPS O-acetylase OafA/YrhL